MKYPDHIRLPHTRHDRARVSARAIALLAGMCLLAGATAAQAATTTPTIVTQQSSSQQSSASGGGSGGESTSSSLESAAAKAKNTGQTVAMSLIGLAFAVAAIVLAFKRDFREAAGVFVVGIVCVMLASSTGVSVLENTVSSLFGSH